jgi:hypothetical protein
VLRLLGHKVDKRHGVMYLVRWKGKDPATQMPWADSYQPEANVTKDLVCEYNSTLREAESRSVEIDVLPLICPTPTGAALRHRRGRPQRRSAQPEKKTFQEAGCGEVPQRERPAGGRRRPRGARPAAAGAPTVRQGWARGLTLTPRGLLSSVDNDSVQRSSTPPAAPQIRGTGTQKHSQDVRKQA